MPKGLIDRELKNPLNFSLSEWQQAKRIKQDPRLTKAMFRECWQGLDSVKALKQALEEKGYFLAKGDRRSIVAVDFRGEVFALSRWSGVKAKEVDARFKDQASLPSIEEIKAAIAERMSEKLKRFIRDVDLDYRRLRPSIEYQRTQVVARQRKERALLMEQHAKRQQQEAEIRAARLPKGLKGLWGWITGKSQRIKRQNELEAWQAYQRDASEKNGLIAQHLEERKRLQAKIKDLRQQRSREISGLQQEIADYLATRDKDQSKALSSIESARTSDKRALKSQKHMESSRPNSGPNLEMD